MQTRVGTQGLHGGYFLGLLEISGPHTRSPCLVQDITLHEYPLDLATTPMNMQVDCPRSKLAEDSSPFVLGFFRIPVQFQNIWLCTPLQGTALAYTHAVTPALHSVTHKEFNWWTATPKHLILQVGPRVTASFCSFCPWTHWGDHAAMGHWKRRAAKVTTGGVSWSSVVVRSTVV